MKIISTTDLSREGNDCYINEEVALIESKDEYYVVKTMSVNGWAEHKSIESYDLHLNTSLLDAIKLYKSLGGVYRE